MIPSILIVTFLVYVACRIGFNPVAAYTRANPRANQTKVDQFIAENGLYPGVKGYIRGYFEWLGKFIQGPSAWPKSIIGQGDVWEPLRYSFFNTLRLAGTAAVLGIGIGVGLGILASRKPGGWLDTVRQHHGVLRRRHPTVRVRRDLPTRLRHPARLAAARRRVPARASGLRSGGNDQAHDPSGDGRGDPDDRPVLAVTCGRRCSTCRSSDFLRTARSKGIPERRVMWRHSVRNALIPIVTIVALDIGAADRRPDHHREHLQLPGHGRVLRQGRRRSATSRKLLPFLVIVDDLRDLVQPALRRPIRLSRSEDPP